ncbi:cytochrome b561 domain-containing protein [Prunus yedoensis var. nudiflora]|uniref:Cytochrome b561 domain-containing protein n=1 Tax=Prunus yedoensis var. nudiflora TaxID=2094558 RepID=A0A314YH80_PRUYE|nr:cytochrome b561 domain-containing protein [Prunus yedoensis var. nudiflora]
MQTSLKLPSLAISTCYVVLLPLVGCSYHEEGNQPNSHKLSPQMTSNVTVHGLLSWFSMGFLMPVGILIIRMSVREERGTTRARVLFYLHVILQMLSVLLATAGAVMSLKSFENSFNNHHQRQGKEREKFLRSSGLWTLLFTAEVSFLAVYYLIQDKREYIQKQGVILGNLEPITQDEKNVQRQNRKELLPQQPCGKHNALKNLFD